MAKDISPKFIAQKLALARIENVVVRPKSNADAGYWVIPSDEAPKELAFLMKSDTLRSLGREKCELVQRHLGKLLEAEGISTPNGLSKFKEVGFSEWGMSIDILEENIAKALKVAEDFTKKLATGAVRRARR